MQNAAEIQVNEVTMSKIVLAVDGHAFYEKMKYSGCSVLITHGEVRKIFLENKKVPFHLKDGELIRTFIIPENQEMTILIMAHHLAGDGKAIVKFAEEILEILDGNTVSYCSSDILSIKDLHQRGSLPGIYKLLVKWMNIKWKRTGKIFTWDDYERIHQAYWEKHSENLQVTWINQMQLSEMRKNTKKAGVTVNSWIVSEIQRNYPQNELIGIPVSVRGSCNSMNNMTSGIRIHHTYSQKNLLFGIQGRFIEK